MVTNETLLLDRLQAARRLGVSMKSLDRAVKSGALKATRIGARVMLTPAALAEFVERATVEPVALRVDGR